MPAYDSSPVFTLTGHAIVNATTDPADGLGCRVIPATPAASTDCSPSRPYRCVDKRTAPATITCMKMRFVFASHYIRGGFASSNIAGAYVPAITVCQRHISPVPISKLASQPNADYYGLPEAIA